MFKKVLVPTDGSPLSEKAINAAVEFLSTAGGELVVLSVAEPYEYTTMIEGSSVVPPSLQAYELKAKAMAHERVDMVADFARQSNVACDTRVAMSFNPYEEIVRTAEECDCDAIFMASHGRKGLNRLFIGSETQKVLAHTSLPVMVFR
jgi:nucleotide-binding universal stress UspA family protein